MEEGNVNQQYTMQFGGNYFRSGGETRSHGVTQWRHVSCTLQGYFLGVPDEPKPVSMVQNKFEIRRPSMGMTVGAPRDEEFESGVRVAEGGTLWYSLGGSFPQKWKCPSQFALLAVDHPPEMAPILSWPLAGGHRNMVSIINSYTIHASK